MRDIGRKTPIFHTPFHLTCTITHCVSKNAPTLASSSFDKHGLILIIVGKQHQHTFRIWYGCSTFFVPSLLLTVFAFKQLRRKWRVLASLYARKTVQLFCRNTGLYLAGSVSAKQSGWLQNLWTNAGTCTKTCPRYQPLWPATWTMGIASISQKVINKAVGRWRKRLRASMKAKWHHFEHLLN